MTLLLGLDVPSGDMYSCTSSAEYGDAVTTGAGRGAPTTNVTSLFLTFHDDVENCCAGAAMTRMRMRMIQTVFMTTFRRRASEMVTRNFARKVALGTNSRWA